MVSFESGDGFLARCVVGWRGCAVTIIFPFLWTTAVFFLLFFFMLFIYFFSAKTLKYDYFLFPSCPPPPPCPRSVVLASRGEGIEKPSLKIRGRSVNDESTRKGRRQSTHKNPLRLLNHVCKEAIPGLNSRQAKARQGKARQGKARQGKARPDKADRGRAKTAVA